MGGDVFVYVMYMFGIMGLLKVVIYWYVDLLMFVDVMCCKVLWFIFEDIGLCSVCMYFVYGLGNLVWFLFVIGGFVVINLVLVILEVVVILSV